MEKRRKGFNSFFLKMKGIQLEGRVSGCASWSRQGTIEGGGSAIRHEIFVRIVPFPW